jgi:hypothetical protein
VVTKTVDELNEMREQIASGELPADAIKQYYADERRNVFGFDHKSDRSGKPIEQGYGSAQNMTRNSIEAYRKYGSAELEYEKHLARMEAELKATDARRAAERGRIES